CQTACKTAPPPMHCAQSATSTSPSFRQSTHREDLAGTDHPGPSPPYPAPTGKDETSRNVIRPKHQKTPAGACWCSSLMHIYSGAPMHFLSGVDIRHDADILQYLTDVPPMIPYEKNNSKWRRV